MKILVTGGAGFIGSAVSKKLIERGDKLVIVDNFNDYYDPNLKRKRVDVFLKGLKFDLYQADICDEKRMEKIFKAGKFDKVVHMAAMAGVRNSIKQPLLYEKVNVGGSMLLMQLAVKYGVKSFVQASTSSVYGKNRKIPFSENDRVDAPLSAYAATKRSAELIAHVYHHIHGLRVTSLRYFTVYGPWGRPDMALFKFTKNILADKPIEVYNRGNMVRNFTYIDDVVTGTLAAMDADFDYEIINVGGEREEKLTRFIDVIEKNLGKIAKKKMMPMQPGDVPRTVADISKLKKLGWAPTTRIDKGVGNFVKWYKKFYI